MDDTCSLCPPDRTSPQQLCYLVVLEPFMLKVVDDIRHN